MKYFVFVYLLFFFNFSGAQGEANIWYFGQNAGLDFNAGSPVPLTNGQLVTDEGCATISNANGLLLFYTDGITVYNKNHEVMLNGTGLMGHPSSTQSATIVPKPGTSNLYYIFTTDNENDPNGFRYSIVDINLDDGNGAVTSDKNVLVYTPTIENLGITKHANGVDYWIITHGWDSNSFITYQLTENGLNLNPVITNIGQVITGGPTDFVAAGTIKISPSGSKLAFTSVSDIAQLFNFNNSTGILSNEITLLTEPGELYGAAFSPDESLLYISNSHGKIHQFNLNVPDIPNSIITIHQGNAPGQLQVGPDNKIYIAFGNRQYLGVINNPNVVGLGCNFQLNGQHLGGKISKLGLPSFNQSFFFIPNIITSSNCVGNTTTFSFQTNQPVISAFWNFGDGITSNSLNPTHIYTNPGSYNVSVSIVTPFGIGSNNTTIQIHPTPTLQNNVFTLKQCDDDIDGFSAFNLTALNQSMVVSTNGLTFSYFETISEAENNINPINNFLFYVNQVVTTDQVFVRVENSFGCFSIATLNLIVSTTLIPSSFQRVYTVCDDNLSGSNTDGISTFDFSNATADIQGLFPTGQQLMISYYQNITDALAEQNAITNISSFMNSNSPNLQNIYVRVDSQLNNECLGLGHHITLKVEGLPIMLPLSFRECDVHQNGIFGFDTSNIQTSLMGSLNNVTLSYKDANNNPLPSPLPNPFQTNTQTITVRATNNSSNACYFETTISFIVDNLPIAFPIPISLTSICDDEINPINQNGQLAFDTSNFQAILIGYQTNVLVKYYDESGNILPSPLPNPWISGNQNIKAEVVNLTNPNCKASVIIPFRVLPVPIIQLTDENLVCNDDPSFEKVLNAGVLNVNQINSFTYQWYKNDTILNGQTNYELYINSPGIYKVVVKNNNFCSVSRIINVVSSNKAVIDEVIVTDLSQINSIKVIVSGLGEYQFSLDNELYQTTPIFQNLEPGIYTIFVKDLKGCGVVTKEVAVLGLPKYFTPNNDGFNDYWNLKGVNERNNSNAIIFIFDRYGKLIKQINPLSIGWDGSYQGYPMPANDYWYVITLENGRIIKGHFSLIR